MRGAWGIRSFGRCLVVCTRWRPPRLAGHGPYSRSPDGAQRNPGMRCGGTREKKTPDSTLFHPGYGGMSGRIGVRSGLIPMAGRRAFPNVVNERESESSWRSVTRLCWFDTDSDTDPDPDPDEMVAAGCGPRLIFPSVFSLITFSLTASWRSGKQAVRPCCQGGRDRPARPRLSSGRSPSGSVGPGRERPAPRSP